MESRNSTSVLTLWFWARALGMLAVLASGGIWLESRATILLARPKTERDTATAPAPATPFLDRAASIVTAEAESWGKESGLAPEYLYALSAMNHVQTNLSPGNYDGLAKSGQIPRLMTAEMCLQSGAGLCGSHVDAFERILDRCKIPVKRRTVEFYLHDEKHNTNSNHIAVEVRYKGKWHLFDITSGTVFLRPGATSQDDLMSTKHIKELIRQGKPWRELAITNATNVWCRQMAQGKGDPYQFLAWPETDILKGRKGTITLHTDASQKQFSIDNLFHLVGYSSDLGGNSGRVNLQIDSDVLKQSKQGILDITVENVGGFEGNAFLVVTDKKQIFYEAALVRLKEERIIHVRVSQVVEPLQLQINSENDHGYLTVAEINVR